MKTTYHRIRGRLSAMAAAMRPFSQGCVRHLGVLGAFVAIGTLMTTSALAQSPPLSLVESFEAIPDTGWIPCDPIIAAGPESLVTMVNSKIAIFTKSGTKIFEQILYGTAPMGFWGLEGAKYATAEPWVIYDPASERFMAIATAHWGTGKGEVYLAVSTDATPTGSADWLKWSLNLTGTHQVFEPEYIGQETFPDEPKLGVDLDAVYIAANHFAKDPNLKAWSHAQIIALDKAALLAGIDAAIDAILYDKAFVNPAGLGRPFRLQPVVVSDPASPAMYFVEAYSRLLSSEIRVWALTDDDLTEQNPPIISHVTVPDFDRPPTHVPQLGTSTELENIDARLMSAVLHQNSLWTAHGVRDPAVDAESVVRWYQFDITGLPATDATLVQSGNVDPGAGIHTWYPHINVDIDGNMGLVFSVGGASQYAAIGYTGRLAGDPAGTTFPVQTARAGEAPYTRGGWGEYSGLAIDPSDGYTFWLFHEYPTTIKRKSAWKTFVGAFQLGAPPLPPSEPMVTITAPEDGSVFPSDALVTFTATATDDLGSDVSHTINWFLNEQTVAFHIGDTTSLNFADIGDGVHTITAVATDANGTGSDAVTITVGTLPPSPSTVSVASITYATAGGPQANKHLLVTVSLEDGASNPVSGASVSIELLRNGALDSPASGTTGTDGKVTFERKNAPSGTYTTTVTGVTATDLTWDGGTPDNSFTK